MRMEYNLTGKQKKGVLAAFAVLFFLVYLSLCFNNNIWTDEAFTIELLKSDVAGILHGTASDVHPPLYYLIAKCFTGMFGSSLLSLKLVSIIPMLLCMTWGAGVVWKQFGFHAALLFQLFLGVIPCTMEYAVQVRMYSWAIFFVTFMSLWAYEAYTERKWRHFAGVVLTSAAAAYTHYFAFVSAIWIYGFLFLALAFTDWRELRKWLVSVAASVVIFLPWLPYMELQVKGVSRNYWIEEITGETVREFIPFLFGMDIPWSAGIWFCLLLAGIVLSAGRIVIQRERKEGAYSLLLLAVPILTAVTGIVISNLMRPVFIVRYLLPCMGLVALALAVTLARYADRKVFLALLLFLLCTGAVDYKRSVYLEYEWTHTAQTEAFLAEHVKENDIIAYNYESYKFIYDCYWDDSQKVLWQDIDLGQADYDTIWLLDTIYWPTPTDDYLAQYGWQRTFMGNYGIEHNDFKIYGITRIGADVPESEDS
ncbi:glycosyltransferase family 39 protein [Lachnospiraceae bacterium JLR.KK008]